MKRKLRVRSIFAVGVILLFFGSMVYIFRSKEYRYLAIILPMFIYTMAALRRLKKPLYNNVFNVRVHLYWYICIFFTLVLGIRFFNIQVINNSKYSKRATDQAKRVNEVTGSRGKIYDRSERVLAYDVNEYDFIINPIIVSKSEKLIGALKTIDKEYVKLNINPTREEIERLSQAKSGAGYRVVVKDMDEDTRDAIVDYLSKRKIYIGSALQLKKNTRRGYNEGSLNHVLGLVAETRNSQGKKVGIFGVESEYEGYLKGRTVKRKSMFTSAREMKLPTSADQLEISANGRNLHLTIDSFLQYILSEEVKKKYDETKAEEAVGIIMDPRNGKILASTAYSRKNMSLRNPVTQNQYEPGSTFKPIIVSAALEDGSVRRDDIFDVGDGRLRKYNHTIRESSRKTRGELTVSQVLEKSSNVGMVLISDEMKNDVFEDYLRRFGIGSPTGIDLPGEVSPYLAPSRRWDGLKKNTMAFGQGIAMTPVQLVTAFSAVVNGGILYKPYVVEKVTDEKNIVIRRNVPEVRDGHVISPKVSADLRWMLGNVVANGAVRAQVEGYEMGGKTGTAQISGPGGYLDRQYLTSFIGFFPLDEPRYVILTMFSKPQVGRWEQYGGVVAAPVFSNIAKRIIKYDDMKPEEIKTLSKQRYLEEKKEYADLTEMPDLAGRSIREAMRILSPLGVDVKAEGEGTVQKQTPKEGSSLEGVEEVRLYLR